MKYLLAVLALLSMSCIQGEEDKDSRRQEIVGFWFPCKADTSAGGNQACNLVDDDGMHYTGEDSVYRIDGALVYAKLKLGDTTAGLAFDIRAPRLVFYGERESIYGTYAIIGDSLHVQGVEQGTSGQVRRSAFRISLEGGFLTIFSVNPAGKRYRKYAGQADLVTREQWEAALE